MFMCISFHLQFRILAKQVSSVSQLENKPILFSSTQHQIRYLLDEEAFLKGFLLRELICQDIKSVTSKKARIFDNVTSYYVGDVQKNKLNQVTEMNLNETSYKSMMCRKKMNSIFQIESIMNDVSIFVYVSHILKVLNFRLLECRG